VQKILDLAGGEATPDGVRDAALRRAGEFPSKLVVPRLYSLFDDKNWKIRWVAAELILRMSDSSRVDEFMARIGTVRGMSLTEPLRYGKLIGDLKKVTVDPVAALARYAGPQAPVPARLVALGYYYEEGTRADLAKIDRYASDTARVPECLPDAKECEWKCTVDDGGKGTLQNVTTVGDFVQYCVKPALSKRASPAPAAMK
jgi:hypothetical protein